VFETFLDKLPGIGSVCSGGRYDNLAGLYTKEKLPGIGASLGLDRLLAALEELGQVAKVSTPAPVFLAFFDAARLHDYLRLAAEIRRSGVGVEFYPEPKKLGAQLKYADRRGFRLAVVVGADEWSAGTCQIKDLASGQSTTVPLAEAARAIAAKLQASA
jgi:histidyl-tRNA synthetase